MDEQDLLKNYQKAVEKYSKILSMTIDLLSEDALQNLFSELEGQLIDAEEMEDSLAKSILVQVQGSIEQTRFERELYETGTVEQY